MLKDRFVSVCFAVLVGVTLAAASARAQTPSADGSSAVKVSDPVVPVISPPLRDIPPAIRQITQAEIENRQLPHPSNPPLGPQRQDDALQTSFGTTQPTPTGVNFDGIGQNGFAPPDTNGRVGPNHFIQWVNTRFAIYSKAGALLFGPAQGNTLFTALGGPCATDNEGDPIAQYDLLADRWILTQFVVNAPVPNVSHQCIAVSVTGDPLGSWYLYDFPTGPTEFVDYPHMGVWPDGYYQTSHVFDFPGNFYLGQGLHVFERLQMLVGGPARSVFVNLGAAYGGALPADLDSLTPPPPGSPGFVIAPGSAELDGSAFPMLHIWKAAVTWGPSPTLAVTGPTNLATSPFVGGLCGFFRDCIPEPPPAAAGDYVDAISDRLLYRVAYRNFGSHESLVFNHTVNVAGSGNRAGVRWYELRSPASAPAIFQQGTFAPADAKNRWMGSIAMDNSGDMALGYSISDATSTFPSISLTGRLSTDAAGTMGSEILMMSGAGSQIGTFNRWGDYSAMTVDPRDGCTFWYTNQYLPSSGVFNWSTRIASFAYPTCAPPAKGTISGTVTDGTNPVANALVAVSNGYSAATDASGNYAIVLPPGSYTVQASRICGASGSQPVTVTNGNTSTANFTVPVGPGFSLGGPVLDDSIGNGNGIINKDECVRLTLPLHNIGCATATGVTATLTTSTPGVTISQPASAYPNIATSGTQSNSVPFQITTSPSFVCGTPIGLTETVTTSAGTQVLTFAIPSCQTPALVFSGSITSGDPTQTGRLNRLSPLGSCAGKTCPGTLDSLARHYDLYSFTNTSSADRCVTIVTTTSCSGSNFIFPVAYLGTFNPSNLCANYLGDSASSPNPSNEFYVDVPAGQMVSLVVHEVSAGAGCSSYSVSVYGLLDSTDGGGGNDLSVTNVDSADPILVGANVTYTVTVKNNGLASASGVTLTDTLPAGTPVSVTPSVGSCSGTTTRTCSFGTLAAGASATLTIVMTAPGTAGTITNAASVSSGGCDPNGANNSVSQSTSVVSNVAPFALSVDTASSAGTSSNTNNVLEPGETVLVKPSWKNFAAAPVSAFTGGGTNPTGPAGATYALPDAAAAYGGLSAGGSEDCGSNCYQFSVSNPATRPAAHWDASFDEALTSPASKTWVLHVGNSFADVPNTTGFYRFVETLFHKGITGGCGGNNYCPNNSVTRAQMAVFLLVGEHGTGYAPPLATGIFADVPASDPFAKWIEQLYHEGITGGCNTAPLQYCPSSPVTRAQMAVFLLIAKHGTGYVPPPATGTVFADVPASNPFAKWIEELAAEGVTAGCGGGNYCPNDPNTRAQMAVFLTTTFSLTLYGP